MIWLIDYTHYSLEIDDELARLKRDYFRIKGFVRNKIIGPASKPKSKVFSTGLLRIATILQHNGVVLQYLHWYQLEDLLKDGCDLPEIIAFSAVCPTVPLCAKLCERIKLLSPSTKVAIGGAQINVAYDKTRKQYPGFDLYIKGYELSGAQQLVDKPLSLPNGGYVDYALLPFPLSEYAVNTFTVSGCKYECAYCQDGMAEHFAAALDGQISDIKNLLPSRSFVHFFDSSFGYSSDRAFQICKRLEILDHDLLLSCDMRAEELTPELVDALVRAGFVEIRIGLESASAELLEKNHRTLRPEMFLEKAKMIRDRSNIYLTVYSATALPGTTADTYQATSELLSHLLVTRKVDEVKNALYVPYPRDGLDYKTMDVQLLTEDWSKYDRQSFPVFRYSGLSAEEVWRQYVDLAALLNKSWLQGCGIETVGQIPEAPVYDEYVIKNYHI